MGKKYLIGRKVRGFKFKATDSGLFFVDGMKEVLNNPEKYNLMPIPTIQEVEDWLTTEKDLSPEEVITWTGGVVYDLLTGAFEHFKNRTIEKAQGNNSGE